MASNKHIWALSACLLFLVSCGPGFSDLSYEISNNYYYESNDVYNKTIYYMNKSDGKRKTLIDPVVVSFKNNGRYIAVLRQPENLHFSKNIITSELSKNCEYWVIDMKEHSLEGPMNKEKFSELQSQINISIDMLSDPISTSVPRLCFQ